MDSDHNGIRALLQFLRRKVEYQKFVGVPPQESPNNQNNGLYLQQRARACTTCFLFTDPEAKDKLLNPMIVLVVDLSLQNQIALSIFRHSPDSNLHKVTKDSSQNNSMLPGLEKDIWDLCQQFETLSLNDAYSISNPPNLQLLTGPVIITPNKESFIHTMRDISRVMSDFSQQEFNTMIAIGGSAEGSEDVMSDIPEDNTGYISHVSLPRGWTWNLLMFLEENKSLSQTIDNKHRMLANRRSDDSAHPLDLDNIPILVHLGGGDFPSACGALPSGLLMSGAWEDEIAALKKDIPAPNIPRGISFDLDYDAINDDSDDDACDEEQRHMADTMADGEVSIRKKSKISSRKRLVHVNDNTSRDEDSQDIGNKWLGTAMKRCRIHDSKESTSSLPSTTGSICASSKNNGLSCARGREGESPDDMREPKRVFRGRSLSFERPPSKPLSTLIEGIPFVDSDISTLNYSLENQQEEEGEGVEEGTEFEGTEFEPKQLRPAEDLARRTIETTRGDEVLLDESDKNQLSDGDDFALTKQISPKRKFLHSYERPPKRVSPLYSFEFEQGGQREIEGRTSISDTSPITSGEEESEEDEAAKLLPDLDFAATSLTHVSSFLDDGLRVPDPRAAEEDG